LSDIRLESLFEMEKIEQGLYRGQTWDLGFGAVFGGQVLGQAIASAYNTVDEERMIHSLHSYFLLPGDAKKPVIYDLNEASEGNTEWSDDI
jgi:acyl-CoA thioesterase-2